MALLFDADAVNVPDPLRAGHVPVRPPLGHADGREAVKVLAPVARG